MRIKYRNTHSFVKDIMRNYVLVEFSKLFSDVKNRSILSLPADNFIFEKKLLEIDNKVRIVCVERDKATYREGQKKIKRENLPIEHYNCTDTVLLSNTDNKFHGMWLDYCGPLTKALLSSLIPIVQGRYSQFNESGESLICITLLKGRETDAKELRKGFGYRSNSALRNGIPEILNTYANFAGKSICVQKVFEYKDSTSNPHSCTMLLYILKIKHGVKDINKVNVTKVKY
jgi:hypothetical protein